MDNGRPRRRQGLIAARQLWVAAAITVVAVVVAAPVSCSASSDDVRPSCDTVLGYRTPLSDGFLTAALVLLVVLVAAALRLRRRQRP